MPRGNSFGTIREFSGGFSARYTGPDGRKYSSDKSFPQRTEAKKWLAKIQTQIASGEWKSPDVIEHTYTLSEYVEIVLKRKEAMGRKERTIEEYRRYWHRSIEKELGPLELSEITPHKVATWYAKLGPKTPTERSHTYSFLRTVMREAERDGLIENCPCKIVGAGQVKRAGVTELPTDMEIIMAVSFMPEQYRLMLQMGGGLGMRSGEVRGLQRGDFDLVNRKVRIQRGVVRHGGKEHLTTTKSRFSKRTLDIPTDLIPVIEEHLSEHVGSTDDAQLFPNVHGGLMSAQSLTNYWVKAKTAAGIPKCRFHDLRHYAATMAVVRGGASEYEAVRMLGQADSRVLRRYLDDVQGRGREIVDKMPSLVGSAR